VSSKLAKHKRKSRHNRRPEASALRRRELVAFAFPESPTSHKLIMLTAVSLPFLGMIAAIAVLWPLGLVGWLDLAMVVGGWLFTGLGITIGFHRLLTHRSFDTYRWVKLVWMTLGALSVGGSPLVWCAVHRRHHEMSDQPGDPHSPHLHGDGVWNSLRGLWYGHTGWLFTGYWSSPDLKRYVPDLLADPALVAVDRLYYLWVLTSLALPAAIGGLVTWTWQGALLGLVWGGLVRICITHHITWSINSICHVFGSRNYATGDESRDNLVCGLLGLGEGWHNSHHAFPTSARHGLAWWQVDASWLVIRGLELVGLAWNVRLPSERALAEKAL
jgi:stearoyl-CoA desaturase (delta-9 desaturase)